MASHTRFRIGLTSPLQSGRSEKYEEGIGWLTWCSGSPGRGWARSSRSTIASISISELPT